LAMDIGTGFGEAVGTMHRRLTGALCCLLGLGCFNLRAGDLYYLLKEIPIGGEGGWDYLSVDPAGRRLYASHATKIVVIDTDKDEVAGKITGTLGVHGFAIASALHRGFSSNGRENTVSVVDLRTLKTMMKVATGDNPDAIIYEPGHREVYAFNGRGNSATVIDAATGKVAATVPLPGKPEFAAADPSAGRVYCNLEDQSRVAAIDTTEHRVVATWPIAPGAEASGMAIDAEDHRLFIGCHSKLMEMIDDASGKVIGSVPIGTGVDANCFDPGTKMAFASCGDGTTTIAWEESPEKFTLGPTLTTRRGARTMALDTVTHKIYFATADYEAQPESEAEDAPRKRPRTIPNTFKVLVYGMVTGGVSAPVIPRGP
jgi:YVTN family beta-propeller protein